ncbi:AraC family transcriptional regulator [Alkalicoccobacillus murimartini]|uniref:AraC-like DNA-binding protein/quercetin dioxygenase-like cupin family protein n=1 Tax=Alkalicoccobacillus murimartini TaxID=171685 RepID=A0ABT9YHQ1_9BACI|nr:AraC family transcriptional regulator [Alkalicoccobacillus murimartini]MDQ0207236.1 AraC-like DNA-binding protein/quercetin dioxygenase-like cupin family protein [Alkalicoccobacillus murimartini]
MKEKILEELMPLTDEEKDILSEHKVSHNRYTSQPQFTMVESKKFLTDNETIMVRKHTRFIQFPRHKHDYIEMSYVLQGSFTQTIAGKRLTLNEGELMFLNQHIEHEIDPCSKEDIIINFIIQPSFFEYIFSFLNIRGPIYRFLMDSLYTYSYQGQYLTFKTATNDKLQELILTIINEILNPVDVSEARVKLQVGLLIVELSQNEHQIEGAETLTLHSSWMQETLSYINQSYSTATLTEISHRLNQHDYVLSRAIKQMTNQTFKELLQEKRLTVACDLMTKTDLPITMVVNQVGYDNVSYFYRIFQKRYGMTPKKFRESSRDLP